ncbi:MAG: LysE family translocator [Deferrisomatales bacterium]
MFGIHNYGSFVAAVLVFQLVPGPGTFAILNATARGGLGAGFGAVLGTLAGDFAYMLAAVLGLAAVLAAYPGVLGGAQWLGAAYLCWLGWRLLRAPVDGPAPGGGSRQGGWRFFRQAFAVSLTNPKVVLFFMAFFPLFLGADASPTTLAALMAHVTALSFLYQAGLVLVGHEAARRLARWGFARRLATRLAGVALIGFGVKLALGRR